MIISTYSVGSIQGVLWGMKEFVTVEEMLQFASTALENKNYSEAKAHVEAALLKMNYPLGLSPPQSIDTHLRALVIRGSIAVAENDFQKILQTYWTIFQFEGRSIYLILLSITRLIIAYQALGRGDETEQFLPVLVEIEPTEFQDWFNKGLALGYLARNDEAAAAFREALKIKPSYPRAVVGLKTALRYKGNDVYSYTCPECGTEQQVPMFPPNFLEVMGPFNSLFNDYELDVDSGTLHTCTNCNYSISFAWALCMDCYIGYYSVRMYSLEGQDGTKHWSISPWPCNNCDEYPQEKSGLSEQELEMRLQIKKLVNHRLTN